MLVGLGYIFLQQRCIRRYTRNGDKRITVIVAEIVDSQNRAADAYFKHTRVAVDEEELRRWKSTITSSPPCGKICSYKWDRKEDGKYYPLLYKAVNCTNTLYRMAHSPYAVIRPPPRLPPPELLSNFTIDGQCPVLRFRYYDNSNEVLQTRFEAKIFRKLLKLDSLTNINSYKENVLKLALNKYKYLIHGKRVAVVGTEVPWAEAMLLNLGATNVTTIEYRELVIEDERVTTITPYRLANEFVSGQCIPFDTVFTYSSLEHSGLGRYGDPITPFGDLEATAQVWCMVKPGGYFILAVPVSGNPSRCSIIWNANRVYGNVRLQHLTANWRVLEQFISKHRVFILQKVHDSLNDFNT